MLRILNEGNKVFTPRNGILVILFLFFILILFVGSGYNGVWVRVISVFIATLTMITIMAVLDAFRSGAFTEKNKKLNDARETLKWLFENARSEIIIVSGELNPILYTDKVIETLKSAKINNKKLKIKAIITKKNTEQNDLIEWLSQNAKPFEILNRDYAPHYIIIDGSHVRAEHIHKENGKYRTADISLYAPRLARFYMNRFNELLKNSSHPEINLESEAI